MPKRGTVKKIVFSLSPVSMLVFAQIGITDVKKVYLFLTFKYEKLEASP